MTIGGGAAPVVGVHPTRRRVPLLGVLLVWRGRWRLSRRRRHPKCVLLVPFGVNPGWKNCSFWGEEGFEKLPNFPVTDGEPTSLSP